MSEKIQEHDFIEVDYTGMLADGTVFDTTQADIAQKHNFHAENRQFGPVTICVGEQQILSGLDKELVHKDLGQEYTIKLSPEHAFGKRDIKRVKIVPMSTFREHDLEPHPGLQIDMDGERGTVTSISGGRVVVNFNHPLSGKEVVYTVTVRRKITNPSEQITAFLHTTLQVPSDKIKVQIQDGQATVEMPLDLPAPMVEIVGKKLATLTHLNAVVFQKAAGEQPPSPS